MEKRTAPDAEHPCVRRCCLNLEDICLGCGRHYAEIIAWHRYTPAEREAHWRLARQRMAQQGPEQDASSS